MNHTVELYAIRDDGRRFTYNSADWGLLELTGIDFAEVETFKSPRGVGDGDLITGQRRKSREIGIKAHPREKDKLDLLRQQAISFHDIKHRYDVHVVYMGVHRIAKHCKITTSAMPTGNVYKKPKLTLIYLSEDPDLYSAEAVEEAMVEHAARWALPRCYTQSHKLLYATEETAADKIIIYEGVNPAPLKIEISATGYNRNPSVTVGAMECHFTLTLNKNDVLVIDSEQAFATVNGRLVPYMQAGGFDMRQFRVFNGENRVKITAEQGDAFTTKITYTGRYNGV